MKSHDASTLIAMQNFGSPIPSLPGPAVMNSIGIRLDFNLTALDSASFTSNHAVQPDSGPGTTVPVPGTALLSGLGPAFLAARHRR